MHHHDHNIIAIADNDQYGFMECHGMKNNNQHHMCLMFDLE